MEWQDIVFVVIGILGLLIGGAFWGKFNAALKLMGELANALHATAELFDTAAEALKDRKVTKAEAVLLLKAWQEACAEFNDVYDALKLLLPASAIKFLIRR